MKTQCPRIMITGTGSGCGKTTLTCGLLSALKLSGKKAAAFKCGPDYIDPMFHTEVLGTQSRNLDLYLCGEETVKYLFARNAEQADIAVIEGVMGMYDGLGFQDDTCSANHVARVTETPQLLAVNVRGKSISLAAEISGYMNYAPNRLAGVILNNCSAAMYPAYRNMLDEQLGIRCYGYMEHLPDAEVGSRHLGLITAAEIDDLKQRMRQLGQAALKTLDMEGIMALASSAVPVGYSDPEITRVCREPVRIGIAKDRAFCFYYQDALDLLEDLGAELIPFSPVRDTGLPEHLDGLIFGGGYPELYLEQLSGNGSMRGAIRGAARQGMPVYAECGGFMYLGESIESEGRRWETAGVIPGNSRMTDRLVRFGYKELTADKDGVLCRAGEKTRCHEFHYSDTDTYGEDFTAENRRGRTWKTGWHTPSLYAGYPHMHFWSNPAFAANFVRACSYYRDSGNKGGAGGEDSSWR